MNYTKILLKKKPGYNSVQMFEPFQEWNPHLFGLVSQV